MADFLFLIQNRSDMKTASNCFLIITTVCMFLFTGCTKSDSGGSTPAEQKVLTDISYGSHSLQKMDIYLPANRSTSTTLIIFLHGGGFVAGDKNEVANVAQLYLDKGYAVANINYRLVDTTGLLQTPILHRPSSIKIADQLADIQAAVNKLKMMVPEWQISTSRWIIAGHSAGATLSLLYAHGANNSSRQIKAAANFAGATSFAYFDESEAALQPAIIIEVLYRATGYEATNANKLAYMAISPYWVSNNTTNGVPVINVRPSNDSGDDLYQSYTQLLSNKGIVNQYTVIQGAGHGFDPEGKWGEAVGVSDVFLGTRVQ